MAGNGLEGSSEFEESSRGVCGEGEEIGCFESAYIFLFDLGTLNGLQFTMHIAGI